MSYFKIQYKMYIHFYNYSKNEFGGSKEERKQEMSNGSIINLSIEANIGGGKSTLGRTLAERYPEVFNLIPEPVDALERTGILKAYYDDKQRWAAILQNFVLIARIISHRDHKKHGVINLIDRSIMGDKNVFAKMLIEDGMMNDIEVAVYNEYHKLVGMDDVPTLYVYIRTPVDVCIERIAKRGRASETTIPKEYLQKIHDLHETWMETIHPSNILILDGTQSVDQLVDQVYKTYSRLVRPKIKDE